MLYLAAETEAGGIPHDLRMIIFWTWVAMAIIIAIALIARNDFGIIPRGWGAVFEHTYDWMAELSVDMMGKDGLAYVPFAMTIFLFVLVSNWMGLIPIPPLPVDLPWLGTFSGMEAPTSNYHTTFALAVVSFLGFNFFGLHKSYERQRFGSQHSHMDTEGHEHPAHPRRAVSDPLSALINGFFKWLDHYIQPTPMLWRELEGPMKLLVFPLGLLFLFLNIVEEWARLISLTMRLFGNIFGEHSAKTNLFVAMGMFGSNVAHSLASQAIVAGVGNAALAVLMWLITAFVTILGALAGFIQAFIFAVLTLSYIAHVVAEEH